MPAVVQGPEKERWAKRDPSLGAYILLGETVNKQTTSTSGSQKDGAEKSSPGRGKGGNAPANYVNPRFFFSPDFKIGISPRKAV